MATGRLHVDEAARRVVWHPSPVGLWLRGAVFVLLGIGLPALTLGAERSSLVTIPVLLVTAVTATWFVTGLRQGWELDEHGIETDIGRRRTTRLGWAEVRSLRVDDDRLVATTPGRGDVTIAEDGTHQVHAALDAATDLGILPAHVTIPTDEACGS